MKCKRCGRKLRNRDSIRRGYGLVCWNKILEEKYRQKKLKEFKDEEE